MKKLLLVAGLLSSICAMTLGQSVVAPLALERWNTEGAEAIPEKYMGKETILIKSGMIFLKDIDLEDGIIEADISFPAQRSFPGFSFRLQDRNNFENFYVRPHQSGNPDATQYTPVFNGQAGWQLYHGEGYSAAAPLKPDDWHHIKIDLHGLQAEIYVDDMQKPLIKVTDLKRDSHPGKIGLSAGGAPVTFCQFAVHCTKPASPSIRIPTPANGTGGLVTKWQVSNTVDTCTV